LPLLQGGPLRPLHGEAAGSSAIWFRTSKLLRLVGEGRLDPTPFATHRFELDEMTEAYDTFGDAARTNALKVVLTGHPVHLAEGKEAVATAV
jgi:Zn-dependent alcohol dehydrogenase